jgi:hypothetical protein
MSNDLIPQNELADRINAEHEEVKKAFRHGAEHAIEAGRLLVQAKATVRHGQWMEWVAENCLFSERTAQLYMRLAQEWPLVESKTQRIADLTLSDAIKLLEPLKSPDEPSAKSSNRRTGRKNPVADAIKQDPLAILQRAWDAANSTERDIFMKKIESNISPSPPAARPSTTTEPPAQPARVTLPSSEPRPDAAATDRRAVVPSG